MYRQLVLTITNRLRLHAALDRSLLEKLSHILPEQVSRLASHDNVAPGITETSPDFPNTFLMGIINRSTLPGRRPGGGGIGYSEGWNFRTEKHLVQQRFTFRLRYSEIQSQPAQLTCRRFTSTSSNQTVVCIATGNDRLPLVLTLIQFTVHVFDVFFA